MYTLRFDQYHNVRQNFQRSRRKLHGLIKSLYQVINGKLKGAEKQYYSINPFTEEKLWDTPVASEQDLEEAVEAANVAFQTWKHSALEDRRTRIKQFANELLSQKSDWTDMIIKETGQPVSYGQCALVDII